jgi:hypothetical protein
MDIVVVKDEHAKLRGFGEKGQRAWLRFRKAIEALEIGETLSFSWHKPRSPKFHRLYFAMLGALFDMQEQFVDIDQLRAWLTVGAGYADFAPGPKGRMVALPKSIAWHRMDDNEFRELVLATWDFLRSAHATRFLWPALSDMQGDQRVTEFLLGYEP